jgi:hypothetical protein
MFGHPRKALPSCASSPGGATEETFIRDVWQAWDGERPEQTKALVDNVALIGGTALQLLPIIDGMDEAMRLIPELTIRDGVISVRVREYRNRVISEQGGRNPGDDSGDATWVESEAFRLHDAGFETTTEFANDPAKMVNYQRKVDQMDGNINLTWSFSILRELVDRGQLQHDGQLQANAPYTEQEFNRLLSTREEKRFALQKNGAAWDGIETAAFGAIKARTGRTADVIVTTAGSLRMANVVRRDRQDHRLGGAQAASALKGPRATDAYGEARSRVYDLKVLESQNFKVDDGETIDPTVSSDVFVSQRFHLLAKDTELDRNYKTSERRIEIMDGDICDWKTVSVAELLRHSGIVDPSNPGADVPEDILAALTGRGRRFRSAWDSQNMSHAMHVMLAGREKDYEDRKVPLPYANGEDDRAGMIGVSVAEFVSRMRKASGLPDSVGDFVDEFERLAGNEIVKVVCAPIPNGVQYGAGTDYGGEVSWRTVGAQKSIIVPFDDVTCHEYAGVDLKGFLNTFATLADSTDGFVRDLHTGALAAYEMLRDGYSGLINYPDSTKIVGAVAKIGSATTKLVELTSNGMRYGLKEGILQAARTGSSIMSEFVHTLSPGAASLPLRQAKGPTKVGSTWVRHVMGLDMSKGSSWKFLAEIDVPLPVSFLMFRPRMRFKTGSMTMLCSGINTGAIVVRDKMVNFTVSNHTRSLEVRASFRAATLVLRPENIEYVPDILSVGYMGGAGTKFVSYHNRHSGGDMYAVAVPYNYTPGEFYTDMTGQVSTQILRKNDSHGAGGAAFQYPTAEHYAQAYGWNEEADDMVFMCAPETQGRNQEPTLMVQAHQKYFNPKTGQCDINVAGKDTYGAITGPASYASFHNTGTGRNSAEVFRM